MIPPDVLDEAVVALVRRWGRRGMNEATVWTVLRAEASGLSVAECNEAVGRLVAAGRLYRNRRRTRTMLQVAEPTAKAAPQVADLFSAFE